MLPEYQLKKKAKRAEQYNAAEFLQNDFSAVCIGVLKGGEP
jgi:hypothetical protein